MANGDANAMQSSSPSKWESLSLSAYPKSNENPSSSLPSRLRLRDCSNFQTSFVVWKPLRHRPFSASHPTNPKDQKIYSGIVPSLPTTSNSQRQDSREQKIRPPTAAIPARFEFGFDAQRRSARVRFPPLLESVTSFLLAAIRFSPSIRISISRAQ
ncbi:unnamed protein product [Linum trigynum]|uniref:Uncharacterized protein n=1 Tax=Linum trigynum TaxID=586398 RepID=A0AAV2FU18_9ROSI